MDSDRFERLADFEPLAASLRGEGYDAVADDAGHANYVVRVTIPEREVAEVLIGCEDGHWGINLFDADDNLRGGESFADLERDSSLEQIVSVISAALFEIDAGRNLAQHGWR